AAMGHPEPFHLKMMGVGNEQWGPQYVERYTIFTKAIKDKYPDIRLVNSVGPNPDGDLFNFLNDTLRKLHADILDEHYYRQPEWFLQNAGRYDHYDRNGPKIFAGEYAAQSKAVVSPQNQNNWQCALSEAAYMTGLERNANVVQMASYAPLFAHVEGWQWTPDLIWYDNLRSYGTPDYYVQKLFSTNKGSVLAPLTLAGAPLEGQNGLYGSATLDNSKGELVLKLVNTTDKQLSPVIMIEGVKKLPPRAFNERIHVQQLDKTNSLDEPTAVSPEIDTVPIGKKNAFSPLLLPYSVNVIRVEIQMRIQESLEAVRP
ncbi:MAG TPA: alpha-L-arabinofuranosidase C-terminal domain-containing protein, partial [Puia sp.]|nr:alpha-L-arabinofuranosidase C-terminal domain-containing protein [Puia sp.]